MKYVLLSFFFILSANVFSQEGFYLRPQMERKWNVNPGHEYTVTTDQGYTVKIDPLRIYTENGFDIGVHAGYRTKNIFFEFGISQDESSAGVHLTATSYLKASNKYYLDDVNENIGLAFVKYPVKVGIKLFGNENTAIDKQMRWEGFLQGGIDFLKRLGGPGSVRIPDWSYTFVPNQGDTLLYTSVMGSDIYRSYLLTLGFTLKGYNKKGQNVITFGLHYSQGRQRGLTTYNEMTFTNFVDGKVYVSYIHSNSSGIYFNISKDIYPINIFKKLKKKKELSLFNRTNSDYSHYDQTNRFLGKHNHIYPLTPCPACKLCWHGSKHNQ